jgi:hypothetical protein
MERLLRVQPGIIKIFLSSFYQPMLAVHPLSPAIFTNTS